MKKSWLTLILILVVVLIGVVVLNYQAKKQASPFARTTNPGRSLRSCRFYQTVAST